MPVTINGTNGLTFNNGTTQAISGGMGTGVTAQTWQDLTASRAFATTYTNSTGYPIMVAVTNYTSGQLIARIRFVINGAIICRQGPNTGTAGDMYANINIIVPNGATYAAHLENQSQGYTWFELR